MSRRLAVRLLVSAAVLAGSLVAGIFLATTPAHADACYTWSRTLRQGMTGSDVTELQIRVAGWPGYNARLSIDGDFGPATKAAVTRFQQAYGLTADGIAGSQTYNRIYALQDDDCTPIHFTYAELNRCNSNWSGGAVSASAARANARQVMWRLEALRRGLGDQPINVSGGFRSYACNGSAGGASNSHHLYGRAADLVGSVSLCRLAQQARYHGFGGIFGPGYPDHNDHTHVDIRSSTTWRAPSCGI